MTASVVDTRSGDYIQERLRRVQQEMRLREIDVILAYKVGSEAYAYGGQGYFRYLAPAIHPLPIPPAMVVVPTDGPATAVLYRGLAAPDAWTGPSLRIETCEMTGMTRLRSDEIAKAVAAVASTHHPERVGIVLLDELPSWLLAALRDHLPGSQFVDATQLLDELVMVKTPHDIEAITRSAALAESVIDLLFDNVRAGITELGVVALAKKLATEKGAEYADLRLASSNPQKSEFGVGPSSRKAIAHGDHLHVGVDISLDGYWVNVVRRGVLGTPTPEYAELSRITQGVYAAVLERLVPGARAGDAVERAEHMTADYLAELGITNYEFQRLGHGIGFENQEPPFLIRAEDTVVDSDMVFAVHPGVLVRGIGQAATGGIVRVTPSGTQPLVKFDGALREIGT